MRVKLLSIGDELLLGQTVNTNAAWMGRALTDEGWRVIGVVSLPDTPEDIKRELDLALGQAEVVLVTGGLGPTKDDLTKHVLAEHFGTQLVMHEDIAASIQNWFESRNVPFLEVNRLQAMLPEACTVLPNPLGTASGMWFERPGGKVVVSMPGVPYEMEGLMTQEVLPRLRRHFEVPTTLYETVVTAGIGESSLAALVAEWEDALPSKGVSIAYLPSPGQVKVRLGVQGPAEERTRLAALLNDEVDAFVAQAQRHVIGRGRSGLPEAVLSQLRASSQTLCTAESCTGGTVASMLTAVPGASASMMGAVVAYDNGVKVNQLGVSRDDLDAHGAVSETVVKAMARGAKALMGTDWAISTSGIAGPSGGTPEKPVGTVWMAISGPDGEAAWCHRFGSQRERIVQRASRRILTHLHAALQEGGVKGLDE